MSRAESARLALPYEWGEEGPQRVGYAKQDENMHAAGGHLSTARDLARYLLAHLNDGMLDGQQALPAPAIRATHVQHAEQNRRFGSFRRFGWSLGWDLATYEGEIVLQRFGGFSGFHSHVSFMPTRGIGVVVLGNGGTASGVLADAIATYVYDRALDRPGLAERRDTRLQALADELDRRRAAVVEDLATRRARPQQTVLPLSAYVGVYENDALGRMEWSIEAGRLHVRMGVAQSDVEVYNGTLHQFRVALMGGGSVVAFDVPVGSLAASLWFRDRTFSRRVE